MNYTPYPISLTDYSQRPRKRKRVQDDDDIAPAKRHKSITYQVLLKRTNLERFCHNINKEHSLRSNLESIAAITPSQNSALSAREKEKQRDRIAYALYHLNLNCLCFISSEFKWSP